MGDNITLPFRYSAAEFPSKPPLSPPTLSLRGRRALLTNSKFSLTGPRTSEWERVKGQKQRVREGGENGEEREKVEKREGETHRRSRKVVASSLSSSADFKGKDMKNLKR